MTQAGRAVGKALVSLEEKKKKKQTNKGEGSGEMEQRIMAVRPVGSF